MSSDTIWENVACLLSMRRIRPADAGLFAYLFYRDDGDGVPDGRESICKAVGVSTGYFTGAKSRLERGRLIAVEREPSEGRLGRPPDRIRVVGRGR